MIIHAKKTTMNNIVHLESIKKEVVGPRYAFLRQCRYDVGMHIASIALLLHHEIMTFCIKMITHIEKTTMNNIVRLGSIKKEIVGPRYIFLRQ